MPPGHGWSSFFCLPLLLLLALAGCRNRTDTVEMALRAREQDLRVLKDELAHMQAKNYALSMQLGAAYHQGHWQPGGPPAAWHPGHQGGYGPGGAAASPEFAANTYMLKRITLGRGTGAADEDKQPGAKSLQVVIEPRDQSDDVVKAPGAAHITALEVSPTGTKTPFAAWDLSAEQVQKNWKQGWLGSGYVLGLHWQTPPRTKQVRVVVRFKLADGRLFEADKDISVPQPLLLPPKGHAYPSSPWPDAGEVLPPPQQYKPAAHAVGVPDDMQLTGRWQAPSLNGAVKMLPPVGLYPPSSDALEAEYGKGR